MKTHFQRWSVLVGLSLLALTGCGGSTGTPGATQSYAGTKTVELRSTDLDHPERRFELELAVDSGGRITGGKVIHVDSGLEIDQPGLIEGKVRDYFLDLTIANFPGQSFHHLHRLKLQTRGSVTLVFEQQSGGLNDRSGPIHCDMMAAEFADPDHPLASQSGSYYLRWVDGP